MCEYNGTGKLKNDEWIMDAPCQNNGKCENRNGTFICHRDDICYNGEHCELDVNECEFDQSCKNGGVCTNQGMKEIRFKNYHSGLTNFGEYGKIGRIL